MTFPFLDEMSLGRRQPAAAVPPGRPPDHPGLYFIGLMQPLGAIMPLAEAQAEWVADLLTGRVRCPSRAEMQEEIRLEAKMRKRYVASKRHTIQVDFQPYLRELKRERKKAAQRV